MGDSISVKALSALFIGFLVAAYLGMAFCGCKKEVVKPTIDCSQVIDIARKQMNKRTKTINKKVEILEFKQSILHWTCTSPSTAHLVMFVEMKGLERVPTQPGTPEIVCMEIGARIEVIATLISNKEVLLDHKLTQILKAKRCKLGRP